MCISLSDSRIHSFNQNDIEAWNACSAGHQAFLEMLGWSGAGMKGLDASLGPLPLAGCGKALDLPAGWLSRLLHPSALSSVPWEPIHGLLWSLASDGSCL